MAALKHSYQLRLWDTVHRGSLVPKAVSPPSGTMRSATRLVVGCLKSAAMSVLSLNCNQSRVKPSEVPPQYLRMVQGWALLPMASGVVGLKGPILMSESSTLTLHPTTNNASPPRTESMRGSRSGPMNSVCGKCNTAPLLLSLCRSLVAVVTLQMSATRGSPPCLLRNGISPTATHLILRTISVAKVYPARDRISRLVRNIYMYTCYTHVCMPIHMYICIIHMYYVCV